MNILSKATELFDREYRIIQSDRSLKFLRQHMKVMQATVDVALSNVQDVDAQNKHYTGNPYNTYSSQINALSNKYNLTADWGCMICKNIVDVRSAFQIGSGVQVRSSKKYPDIERELKFINEFMEFNNINEDRPHEWATMSELEGKSLLHISPDEKKKNIRVVLKPYKEAPYKVTAEKGDFSHYVRAQYESSDTSKNFDYAEPEFVYLKFGGTASMVNNTPPKVAFVLAHMEYLDKELFDWRKNNHLYASPTPVFKVESEAQAKQLRNVLNTINWRLGMTIVTTAQFTLEGYQGEGYTTIMEAIQGDIKIISGTTGVPVHFLGYPDLLSNRATAENLLELIELSTTKERKTWVSGYDELFEKAIVMYNENFKQNLRPDAVNAILPFSSSEKLRLIGDTYLPMYMANAISLETLLSFLSSDIDIKEEIKKIEVDVKKKQLTQTSPNNENIPSGNSASDVSGRN